MADSENMDEHPSPTYLPVKSEQEQQQSAIHKTASRGSANNVERTWSLNDGYSVSGGVDDAPTDNGYGYDNDKEVSDEPGSDTEILVKWDENDPGNPKNMSLARRWLITVFVALGSICV